MRKKKAKRSLIFLIGFSLGILLIVFLRNKAVKKQEIKNESKVIIYKTNKPNNNRGTDKQTKKLPTVSGLVSWYDESYCRKFNPSCKTASGEIFKESAFTAACHIRYKLGSRLLIRYRNKEVVVRCNDRGSFNKKYGRTLDLSRGAFSQLSATSAGVIKVEILSL